MILFAALVTLGGLAVVSLLDKFYYAFARWLQALPERLKAATPGILVGCKTFVDGAKHFIDGSVKQISRNYSKVGEQWHVVSAETVVGRNEVPDEIIEMTDNSTNYLADVTDELEMYLEG